MSEIRVWVGEREKAVGGVTEATSAGDVVISLLRHSRLANVKTIQSHAIVQQWPHFQVAMQGDTKILAEWRRCQGRGVTFHLRQTRSTRPGASSDWMAEDTDWEEPTAAAAAATLIGCQIAAAARQTRPSTDSLPRRKPFRRNSFRQCKQYNSQYVATQSQVQAQRQQLADIQAQIEAIDTQMQSIGHTTQDPGWGDQLQESPPSPRTPTSTSDEISALITETCAKISSLQLQINSKNDEIAKLETAIAEIEFNKHQICQKCHIKFSNERCLCSLTEQLKSSEARSREISEEHEMTESRLSQVEKDIIMHRLKIQRLEFELESESPRSAAAGGLRRAASEDNLLKRHLGGRTRSKAAADTDSDTGLGSLSTEEEISGGLHLVRATTEFVV